jgi:hypothetical protein
MSTRESSILTVEINQHTYLLLRHHNAWQVYVLLREFDMLPLDEEVADAREAWERALIERAEESERDGAVGQ